MENINERLITVYEQLLASDFARGDNSPAAIAGFVATLNKSTPITRQEILVSECARFMHRQNRNGFNKFIAESSMSHFELLLDTYAISAAFRLRGRMTLRWDHKESKYIGEPWTEMGDALQRARDEPPAPGILRVRPSQDQEPRVRPGKKDAKASKTHTKSKYPPGTKNTDKYDKTKRKALGRNAYREPYREAYRPTRAQSRKNSPVEPRKNSPVEPRKNSPVEPPTTPVAPTTVTEPAATPTTAIEGKWGDIED